MTLASCHVMILCQKKEKKKRARFRRAINFKGPPAYSFTPESFAISSSRREPFFFTTYSFHFIHLFSNLMLRVNRICILNKIASLPHNTLHCHLTRKHSCVTNPLTRLNLNGAHFPALVQATCLALNRWERAFQESLKKKKSRRIGTSSLWIAYLM